LSVISNFWTGKCDRQKVIASELADLARKMFPGPPADISECPTATLSSV